MRNARTHFLGTRHISLTLNGKPFVCDYVNKTKLALPVTWYASYHYQLFVLNIPLHWKVN